ncbi:transglutaminase family protein [Limnoglobus roseus]|uniref:Transglutaminase family protein n=1 Tax=Limnoglobus roseus TaxID=2598579 RepID=A0A5C1AL43_9BACT|nr:transglutaminase family protein [Limnoglobus roseus]QEL17904.1 transglutaminase family protein [Limnoglobus roseus]
MIRYRILHRTRFTYTEPVSLCHNMAHLIPRECPWQFCEQSQLDVTPPPAVLDTRTDCFGNMATHFAVQEPHRELTITAVHRIGVLARLRPNAAQTPPWEDIRDRVPEWLHAVQFLHPSCYVIAAEELGRYAMESFTPRRPILDAALELTHRIFEDFQYDPQSTTVSTPVLEVFANRRGVCQDFAHLQIACLRSIGLPARYVSGYLSTTPPPGRPRLVGADASHAWLSIFCGEAGWVDLDPTNDQVAGDRHIQIAWGRDYDDVSPVKGVILGGGQHKVEVSVDAEPC